MMKISKEDKELFKLIELATNGDTNAKWKIVVRFQGLIINNSMIKGIQDDDCYEYVENAVFKSIEKFNTLRNLKKF